MSADKYPSIFSRQMATIVYLSKASHGEGLWILHTGVVHTNRLLSRSLTGSDSLRVFSVLLLMIRETPFACAFSFPENKIVKLSPVFFLPAPVHLQSLTSRMSMPYLYHIFSFVTCAVFSVSNIVQTFLAASRTIVLGPRKLLLELIASSVGFSLGAVILPSPVAWFELSTGPCGLVFIVAVSVTR